uniref:EF-hand domain-containing protein n=1 Tax=Ananas comosus var. bracteatus TaxID=296719 RepID=A0A6V7P7P8_ANACO|nr:unnamed protein product [Ananas comosus var. bracteatus]
MGNSSSSISGAERKPSPPRARSPPPPSAAEAAPRPPEIDLKRIFNKFDADGDGRIREAEVAAMLTRLGCDDDAASMVAAADADGDGYIDMGSSRRSSAGAWRRRGRWRRNDGQVSGDGEGVDRNGDGVVSFEEFRLMMMQEFFASSPRST